MVAATLTEIENWYNAPSFGPASSMLLSKLAIIEFCGWLEGWMDDLIRQVDQASLCDADWTKANVIENNHGFHYDKHLRSMLCKMLGEDKVRRHEMAFEASYPGELESMKSVLGMLWKIRCDLAHADLAAHHSAQLNINAPSWTKNQFKVLSKRLEKYRAELLRGL